MSKWRQEGDDHKEGCVPRVQKRNQLNNKLNSRPNKNTNQATVPNKSIEIIEPETNQMITLESIHEEENQNSNISSEEQNKFVGIEITKASEWEDCLTFSENGLLIVEAYSTAFGPCIVMNPFTNEIINNITQKSLKDNTSKILPIKYVKININEMEDELTRFTQLMNNKALKNKIKGMEHLSQFQSPVPTYLFFRNRNKVAEIKGSQSKTFEEFANIYSKPILRDNRFYDENNENNPNHSQKDKPKKYFSIVTKNIIDKENKKQSTDSVKKNKVEKIKNIENDIAPVSEPKIISKQELEDIKNLIRETNNIVDNVSTSKVTQKRTTAAKGGPRWR